MTDNIIVVATSNPGKIQEFEEMLYSYNLTVRSIADYDNVPEIDENGSTFEENALIKAKTVSDFLQVPVIADDSGLVVKALNGEPGVHSARYAGDHDDKANVAKLLKNMEGKTDRSAYFNTTLVARKPDGSTIKTFGKADGAITTKPMGYNGFGYDPIFLIPELGKTLAQMDDSEKNAHSARGNAVRKFGEVFKKWW